jgi:hypothetical protein
MSRRFDELRQGVDDRRNALAQKLAERYKAAADRADEALKKMEEEHAGVFAGFIAAIGEVIKILTEFKDKLLAVIRQGIAVVKLILKDPIGFLSNLIGAIKAGLSQFVGNIWTHLKKGFMAWLFGALASAGIEIPADLSLPSIFKLVMSVLGLTYERLRAKAVKLIGERNVRILEKLFEYVRTLVTQGPAALWEQVKGDLGNLKAMVIDAIQDWIITKVVQAAITKLVSMFNPAGAIVQAIIAIYNTVMFVIERASQIMAFVEAVLNSVAAIARGAIGAAANWIEQSLARTIPLVIGFLARLVGLGNVSSKIREFIMKVQGAVDRAIDKVLARIVALVKRLFGAGKDGEDPEKQKKLDAGLAALDALTSKYAKSAKKEKLVPDVARVKSQHPVFKTLSVEEKDGKFIYDYTASPGVKKPGPPKSYLGATRIGSSKTQFQGSFDDPDWNWTGCPRKATPHPANDWAGSPNSTVVPKPKGNYKVAGAGTEGAISTTGWRAHLTAMKEAAKAAIKKKNPAMKAADVENASKASIENTYKAFGLPFQDLYLVGWDQHHIHPVNWGGPNSTSNMQFLRRYAEHTRFTTWWNARKKEINDNL